MSTGDYIKKSSDGLVEARWGQASVSVDSRTLRRDLKNLECELLTELANYLPDAQQSMQRFAGLTGVWTHKGGDTRSELFGQLAHLSDCGRSEATRKWYGSLLNSLYPFSLKNDVERSEIVHVIDHSNAFYLRYLKHRPHVVTCHDVLAIRKRSG